MRNVLFLAILQGRKTWSLHTRTARQFILGILARRSRGSETFRSDTHSASTTYATPTPACWQKEGVPLEVVSKRLGHSSIAITAERYLVVYNERDTVAAAAFERLVG